MRLLTSAALAAALVCLAACPPPDPPEPTHPDAPVFDALDLEAAGGPAGLWGFTVADMGGGQSVLFGGTTHSSLPGQVQGATWLIDASTHPPSFEEITTTGQGPSPRYCGCGAYSATRDEFLHVAGRDLDVFFPETFLFDVAGRAWSQISSAAHPDIGIACALAFSESDDAWYLYGGGLPDSINGETWRLPGGGTEWEQLAPTSEPPVRYDSAMRAIDGGDTMMLIGGGNPFDNRHYMDIWLYSVVDNAWVEMETNLEPPGRRVPWLRLTPDEKNLFAGFGSFGFQIGQVHSDLWRLELETGTWTELTDDVDGALPEGRGFSKLIPGGATSVMGYLLTGFDGGELRTDPFALRLPEGEGF